MGTHRFDGARNKVWVVALTATLVALWGGLAVGQEREPPVDGRFGERPAEPGEGFYRVTPLGQTIQLSQPPGGPVEASRPFSIRRWRTPLNERVYYSVEGDLWSDEGRSLPWSAVQISDVTGQWGSQNVLVLDAGQTQANFSLRVLPSAWYDGGRWRYAGTYRGHLIPNVPNAPVLDVTVEIQRLATVEVSPQEFRIVAHSGVGTYESEQPVVLTLRANHSTWSLSRAFSAPRRKGQGPSDVIPLSQVRISEDGGPFLQVPGSPQEWLTGGDLIDPRLVVRTLILQVEVTWEELAGQYEGRMELTLQAAGGQ